MPTPDSYFFISLMNGVAWGGSEELWYRTALYLAAKGAKVGCAVYAWPQKEERLQKLEEKGCVVHRLPQRDKSGNQARRLLKKVQYQKRWHRIANALPVADYETVVVNLGGFEIYATQWRRFYKRLPRYALVFHSYSRTHIFSSRQKRILRAWIQNASVNLFAASPIKETLEQALDIAIKIGVVFINPITFTSPAGITRFPPLVDGNRVFSVFASLDTGRKAQNKLINVLSTEQWKKRQWQLRLYGDGPDKNLLQKLIEDAGLQANVFLKGHTSNVAEAMKESHLILQLTNVDAMPLSVMEAMALARPLAVTRIGDMPVWVHDGKNGWVCHTDEQSIAACLERAWQQRDEWEAMGHRSFEIFTQRFPAKAEEAFLQQLQTKTS